MTIRDLFTLVRKQLRFIIIPSVVLTCLVTAYAVFFMQNRYTASTTLYILANEAKDKNQANLSNAFSVSEKIVEDVTQLIKSDRVRLSAAKKLNTTSQNDYDISVASDKGSLMIRVAVTGPDAKTSADYANALATSVTDVSHEFMGVYSVQVVDEASVPELPSGPDRLKYAFFALGSGIILTTGLLILRNALDDRVRDVETIEELSGMPVLGIYEECGSTKSMSTSSTGLITFPNPKSTSKSALSNHVASPERPEVVDALEASRTILANLTFLNNVDTLHSIVVTAATEQENSPSVAYFLARAAASGSRKVLLMECNFRQRPLSDVLGAHPSHGLRDVLARWSSVEQAMLKVGQQELYFLDAELSVPNPTELLSSDRFRALLATLSEKFSYLILNAPSLGDYADAPILSSLTDATLLVVRDGVTNKAALQKAANQIHRAGGLDSGVAFNRDCPSGDIHRAAYGKKTFEKKTYPEKKPYEKKSYEKKAYDRKQPQPLPKHRFAPRTKTASV